MAVKYAPAKDREEMQAKGYAALEKAIPADKVLTLENGKKLEIIYAKKNIEKDTPRHLVLVLPGGGYEFLSYRESRQIALYYANQGMDTAVLYYTVKYWPDIEKDGIGLGQKPLEDVAYAIEELRTNESLNVSDRKIVLCGFSAGAHLASWMATKYESEALLKVKDWKCSLRPDGQILAYPLISSTPDGFHNNAFFALSGVRDINTYHQYSSELYVTEKTAPAFIWHTAVDQIVPVSSSIKYAEALWQKGVDAELMIFPQGRHGASLATPDVEPTNDYEQADPHIATWFMQSVDFVRRFVK